MVSVPVRGGESCGLDVSVSDLAGRPVPQASVLLLPEGRSGPDAEVRRLFADENGTSRIRDLAPGHYQVVVVAGTASRSSHTFRLEPGRIGSLRLTLGASDPLYPLTFESATPTDLGEYTALLEAMQERALCASLEVDGWLESLLESSLPGR